MSSQKYIKNKIIGISECDNLPDIDAMFRDNSVWSFFGMWNGDYITDTNGTYSEKYNTRDELIKAYNSEGSLNLDEYRTLTGGGELPTGKRNFSEELQKEYEKTTQPEEEINYGYLDDDNSYVEDDYSYDYNDYGYNDYSYDYGYDDYGYDYGYGEW